VYERGRERERGIERGRERKREKEGEKGGGGGERMSEGAIARERDSERARELWSERKKG